MRKAESLDLLSLIISADMADVLFVARLYDESIQQSRKIVGMDSTFAVARFELGQAYLEKHVYAEVVSELKKAVQLSGDSPTCIANLARAYVASGKRNEAVKLLDDLKKRSSTGYSNASEVRTQMPHIFEVDP
jgi:Flp pilus assembly protein TadD